MFGRLQDGWQLLRRHKKAGIYFYLANLVVASLLLFPFMQVFEDSLGPGLYREKLVGELDYDWYGLFQDRVTGFASTLAPWVLGAGPFARNLELLLDGELDRAALGHRLFGSSLYLAQFLSVGGRRWLLCP